MDLEDPPEKGQMYGIGQSIVPHPVVFPPENGACHGKPTEWWYPEYYRTQTQHERRSVLNIVDHAKRICFKCPVRQECLTYSLNHEPFGIWGGFDERERLMIAIREGIIPTRTRLGQKVPSSRPVGRPKAVDKGVPTHG